MDILKISNNESYYTDSKIIIQSQKTMLLGTARIVRFLKLGVANPDRLRHSALPRNTPFIISKSIFIFKPWERWESEIDFWNNRYLPDCHATTIKWSQSRKFPVLKFVSQTGPRIDFGTFSSSAHPTVQTWDWECTFILLSIVYT